MRVPDPGVRVLFTREPSWQAWLDCEAELADAEAELGMVPAEAAAEIRRKARLELIDIKAVEDGLRVTGHPLVPLIWELSKICDGDAGGFVHWGATTQNITQTGLLLQVQKAHRIFLDQIRRILVAQAALAEKTKDYALPGRTHGQHAVPATFGVKVAAWIDEFCRHVERLHQCEPRVFVAMLGGAAGTFASFGAQGQKLQDAYAQRLGLTSMPVPSRTTHDFAAEYVCILAMIGSSSARIAVEIYNGMKEEYGEIKEPIPAGTVGSSTMPQKRNPILCEAIFSLEAALRAQTMVALQSMQGEHEAATGYTQMTARTLSESCGLMGDILERIVILMEGLQVFPDRMRQNLDLSGGLIMSETLMLELAKHIGRQHAHDAIYEAVEEAFSSGEAFDAILRRRPEVAGQLDAETINTLLDPVSYTGLCSLMAEQQAARALAVAGELAGGGRA
jgi:adenylosuccinate lyase